MMKKFHVLAGVLFLLVLCGGCKMFNKHNKGKGSSGGDQSVWEDGQARGIAPGSKPSMQRLAGMVFVPSGVTHLGPSDEDINHNFISRNKEISINGFWMDKYELSNNRYRQFVVWVKDSLIGKELGFYKTAAGGRGGSSDSSGMAIDFVKVRSTKMDAATLEKLSNNLLLAPDNRINNKIDFDPNKILYHYEEFDLHEAAKRENRNVARSNFMRKYNIAVYPDTLVWMRDFSYSYNEPLTRGYFSHPSYGNYPVVGVTWKQANAYCHWRTEILNDFLEKKNFAEEDPFRLPSEAEWEYAARGGRSQAEFPWGAPYIRNKKGCLMANFKPGRGNYPEDGGMYTVTVNSYFANDYGLFNMAGNVAEWTSSYFNEGSYNFMSDLSPDVRWEAKDSDPPLMKRKVVRGGSWKDVGYFIQTSTRTFEYQDSAKSYIGFRCVVDIPRIIPSKLRGESKVGK